MEKLILASGSPRRSELLTLAGIPFEVCSVNVDETCPFPAYESVRILSQRKALSAGALFPGRYILAADTLVELDGSIFGKPENKQDAFRMLRALSGRTHHVFTGVSLLSPDGVIQSEVDSSSVSFCELTDKEIDDYISGGEPMDKAGAYAAQGHAALFITHLDGTHASVMGLPLHKVRELLKNSGFYFSCDSACKG